MSLIQAPKLKTYSERNILKIPQLASFSEAEKQVLQTVAYVFPFKVNEYVLEHLIDWSQPWDDPIFRLTFPHRDMLSAEDYSAIRTAIDSGDKPHLYQLIKDIRQTLNPHPSGQLELNMPRIGDQAMRGMQHKYAQTLLVFPAQGQTCHSYCTFCFRWPQFTSEKAWRFTDTSQQAYLQYLRSHPEITDVLFTGGDPMIMNSKKLIAWIEPLLLPEYEHIKNIRIGTKSLTYWPHRVVSDSDSYELLQFFEKIVKSGKHLAFMAHINHYQELQPGIVEQAFRNIQNTGAVIRSQSPLIRHINDDYRVWEKMWSQQVNMGVVPYYMFIERDTGAHDYFKVSLADSLTIYRRAYQSISGLARTARGPVMSAVNGKVEILDITEIAGDKYFVLHYLQARIPKEVGHVFFAKYNADAYWFSDLELGLTQQIGEQAR